MPMTAAKIEYCHCGLPLHYTNPDNEAQCRKAIAENGDFVLVKAGGKKWLVQRHYIALHGYKPEEVPNLGFREIEE